MSGIKKRSVMLKGHTTSVSVEPEFWHALQAEAQQNTLSLNALIAQIDEERDSRNLSSALRLYVLKQLQHKLKAAQKSGEKV